MDSADEGQTVWTEALDGAMARLVVEQLFDHSPIAMALVDVGGRILDANAALCDFLGRSRMELCRLTVADVTLPEDLADDEALLAEILAGRRGSYRIQKRYLRADGAVVWGDLAVSGVADEYGGVRRVIVQLVDITAEREAHAELARRSSSDPLTGLANREHTMALLDAALRLKGPGGVVGVLYVDVDGFKEVNDTHGHAAGDRLLGVVADRMARTVGHRGVVGRVGGDEFVIVMDEAGEPEEVEAMAGAVRRALGADVSVDGGTHRPTVSIGLAFAGPTLREADDLVRAADTAMYRAKRAGKDRWERYDDAAGPTSDDDLPLSRLDRDAAHGGVDAWFQPIVELRTGVVVGHEALARWPHPERGLLRPAQFMPAAEDRGLSDRVDGAVLDLACRFLAAGDRPGFASVNVSQGFAAAPDLADRVRRVLERWDVAPERVVLEVTEAVVLQLPRPARRDLEALDADGVRIFLDDFGAGYGALAVFDDLPLSGVKLDRSLVVGSVDGTRTAELVSALRPMVDALGMVGVVEGVETQEELDRVRAMGWRHGQGYLLGAPRARPG